MDIWRVEVYAAVSDGQLFAFDSYTVPEVGDSICNLLGGKTEQGIEKKDIYVVEKVRRSFVVQYGISLASRWATVYVRDIS